MVATKLTDRSRRARRRLCARCAAPPVPQLANTSVDTAWRSLNVRSNDSSASTLIHM
jgi:hypothetical protein